MKICISTIGKDLAADVDPRFGRAQRYIIIDTETKAFECIDNAAAMSGGGPKRDTLAVTSRKASSSDRPSTSGV